MSIDSKIITVDLDFAKFQRNTDQTVKTVNKLKDSLKFPDAGKGFEAIDKAAQRVNLSHIASGVDDISNKLKAFHVAALAVFSSIAIKAVDAGARVASAFTLDPVKQGLQLYEQKLNSVQTILANTQAAGTTLKDVNKTLAVLNDYSNKTIYNFGQMAKNIGTFTAAGVDLKTSTESIKGIANLAALSGSNADQAATAMYQLSQAIAAGQVHLQDWNSVVNAGMGGTVFQRALATTAQAMGKLKQGTVKLVGPMKNVQIAGESFRQSLQTGPGKTSWLTSDVLTKTLSQFTGDLTDAQLKAQGFNDAQIKAIQQTAKTAFQSATQVKTLSQLLDVTKETIATGWANTWQIVLGDFGEAKKTFTALSNAINNFVNANAAARNKVLQDWKDLGGRTALINGIKLAFQNVSLILKPIQRAFRDIFPKTTGRDLIKLTLLFDRFAEALRPSPTTMQNLRRTFRGLFAVLDIGKQIIGGIITAFSTLFKTAGLGGGGFLHLTAIIGDFLVSLDKTLKKGNALHKFFVEFGKVLAIPIEAIHHLTSALSNLFSGFSPGAISGSATVLAKSLSPLQKVVALLTATWEAFKNAVVDTSKFLLPQIDQIVSAFQGLGPAIASAIQHMNVEAILQVIRTGLLAGIFVLLKNFLGKGGLLRFTQKNSITVFSLIFKNVGKSMDALTGSLEAMQTNLKSKTLKNIAISIALLAASVVALSFVDPKRLNSAMTALALMFGGLLGALKVMDKITTTYGAAKLTVMAVGLIALAGAIDLLTIAVLALSRLSWDQLKKGLTGIVALLVGLSAASTVLSKNAAGMIRSGIGITAIAVGLNIMALAVKQLAALNIQQLGKGLSGVAIGLTSIALAMKLMPKSSIFTGLSIVPIAVGLNLLAVAIGKFGAFNLKTLGKGILGVAGALVAIGLAMQLMPITLPITAAGLILVGIALGSIFKTINKLGKTPVKVLAQGLKALAISLGILALGLLAMQGAVGGAVALGVAAAGIALLTPALVALGRQSWTNIIKGVVALASAFALLGVAGLALAPVAPALLALGAALVLIGGGLALAGAGIALIGVGLSSIAIAGPTAVAILIKALTDFTASIGEMAKNLVLGLLETVRAFAKTAPAFVKAMVKILDALLEVVIKSAPKIGQAFEVLLTTALKVIRDKAPDIIETGAQLILDLLKGLKTHVTEIIKAAADVIVNFLKGLAQQATKLIGAGFNLIAHIITGITKGILSLVEAGARAIVKFLNGIAKVIRKYEPQILVAGAKIGIAIIQGMIDGLGSMVGKLKDKILGIVKAVPNIFKKHWIIHSPSRLFYVFGVNIIQGLTNGISDNQESPVKAARTLANNVAKATKDALEISGLGSSKVMQQIGRQTAQGFAKGVHGSASDIKSAFTELNNKILDAQRDARAHIKTESEKLDKELHPKINQTTVKNARDRVKADKAALKELLDNSQKDADKIAKARVKLVKDEDKLNEALTPKFNADAIKKSQDAITLYEKILAQTTQAHATLIKTLGPEKRQLLDLANQFQVVSDKLKKANQTLADAKQARDDAFGQFRDQYGALPDIVSTDAEGHALDQLATYEDALKNQAKAVATYHNTLDQLRKLGLDDKTYQKLVEDGTADQQFADQLLAGGKTAIDGLNKLDKNLSTNASSLAKSASRALYQAGVDAAQGIVDGLKSKQSELRKAMQIIADSMVSAMKKSLGIHSPSTVFHELGRYASEGMAKGLIASSKSVTDAVQMVSNDAMGAMRDSLKALGETVGNEIDANPVITPVIDLSEVQNGSKKLQNILNKSPIAVKTSLQHASTISALQSAKSALDKQSAEIAPGGSVTFEQNNYSPEALTNVDIYRQTKTLLAGYRRTINPRQFDRPG